MYDEEQIIEQLGIQNWPEDKRNEAVEMAIYKIGEATTSQLTEQQFNEYQAIVDDNEKVIDAWLAANVPDYKESPVYKELEAGYDDDPEQNNPAKLFASIAWIQVNVPQIQDIVASTLEAYRQELAT